ncbi:MAG: NADH-quinone oxidoreductase subunit NuoE, partial [Methylobacteriaceae bacterium]|nr:NADH-quinone oxidoreductase subunit NuoE [Methylobacteriaceae bacterium]
AAKAEADKAAAGRPAQPAPPPGAAKPAPGPTAPVAPKGVADAPAKSEADKAASPVASSPPQAPMAPASAVPASESLPPAAPAEAKDEIEPSSGLKGALTAQQVAAEEMAIAARLVSLPPDASQEQKADAVGERPQGLAAPRGGKEDDLKRIRGIGKINEGRLNSLGIFHFDQVASWTRPQVMWVGTYLSFPGRIDRENWVEQAKALTGGPEPKTD